MPAPTVSIAHAALRGLLAAACAVACAAASAIGGCGEREAERAPAAPATHASAGGPRIVSLSPAITQTLADLGAAPLVVGRTPWCSAVDPAVPVVGSLEDADLERIAAVEPTLVCVQHAQVPPQLAELARRRGFEVRAWHLDRLADVERLVQELGAVLVQQGCAPAAGRAQALLQAHAQALQPPAPLQAPALLLFSVDPPGAFGAQTYVDELWCALGGRNAVAGRGYPAMSAEDVAALRPAAAVVIARAPVPAWLERAAGGHVVAIEAPELLQPDTRMLVQGPAVLRRAAQALVDGGAR